MTGPSAGSSHTPAYWASTNWTRSAHGVISKAPDFTEVEQHRAGIVQQGGDPQWGISGDEVEVGHAASQQWVPLAKVVMDIQPCHHRSKPLARFLHAEQLGHGVTQCFRAVVVAAKRDRGHRMTQHTRSDRVTLGLVAIEEAFR